MFQTFLGQLRSTNMTLSSLTDFDKVTRNTNKISLKLHQLNHLLGRTDLGVAIKEIYDENPATFQVLGILVAVRDNKQILDINNNTVNIKDYFNSYEKVCEYIEQTGLSELFKSRKITNLVDYVFGVEVGLDTNSRKNRTGTIMEKCVANIFDSAGIEYREQVHSSEYEDVETLGVDEKIFDFVVTTPLKTYFVEANFYNSQGSKLNETARSFTDIAPKINSCSGYEFVWVTDGEGWLSSKKMLEEAINNISKVYNLTTISEFIEIVKNELE